ncbi:MAG: glycosyltransferase [bacterium]
MKWTIVFLNWNSANQTCCAVNAVRQWSRLRPDICVVDNGSRPEDGKILSATLKNVLVVRSSTNRGYGGGLNLALASMTDCRYEAFLFMNTDAHIAEEDAERLLHHIQTNPRTGIVGPVLHESQANDCHVFAGGRNIAFRISTRARMPNTGRSTTPQAIACAYVPGTVFLVSSTVLNTVGTMDETYFFSGEIADFCMRARLSGFQCAVIPSAHAHHTAEAHPLRDTLYLYYSLRNRFLFARKFYPSCESLLRLYWTGAGALMLFKSLLYAKPARVSAIRLALRDGLRRSFGCHHEYFIKP